MRLGSLRRTLDWLDRRRGWQFVFILYVTRWLALVPVLMLTDLVFTDEQLSGAAVPDAWKQGNPVGLFFGLVAVPPLLETLLVCSLPYAIIAWLRGYQHKWPQRSWGFVAVSACAMVALHPIPAAVPATLVTGTFLAYCYAHFAASSTWSAIVATWVFHAGINLVGWIMIVVA